MENENLKVDSSSLSCLWHGAVNVLKELICVNVKHKTETKPKNFLSRQKHLSHISKTQFSLFCKTSKT